MKKLESKINKQLEVIKARTTELTHELLDMTAEDHEAQPGYTARRMSNCHMQIAELLLRRGLLQEMLAEMEED